LNKPANFEVNVTNFSVVDGQAIVNEHRFGLDLSLTNLMAQLIYHTDREILETHLRFDGVLDRAPGVRLAIPYTFDGDLDYVRATVLAQRIAITSGANEIKLQGKVERVLSADISGKMEYT